ncbi:hypothetical protein TNCV_4706491 [Trichonephila clavipes]|nr:hypothetical protein TNCV_4706491 [Trichonephila clavipes]
MLDRESMMATPCVVLFQLQGSSPIHKLYEIYHYPALKERNCKWLQRKDHMKPLDFVCIPLSCQIAIPNDMHRSVRPPLLIPARTIKPPRQ